MLRLRNICKVSSKRLHHFYNRLRYTDMKKVGQRVHKTIQQRLLTGKLLEGIDKTTENYCRSVEHLLNHVRTVCVEMQCIHPELRYRGRLDSIVQLK